MSNINYIKLNILFFVFALIIANIFSCPTTSLVYASTSFLESNITSREILTTPATIGTTNKNAILFTSTTSQEYTEILDNGVQVLVILTEFENSNENYYCLCESPNGTFADGYISGTSITICETQNIDATYKTFFKNVDCYKYPTTLSAKVKTIETSGTELTVLNNANNYEDYNGNKFYAVKDGSNVVYVNQSDLIISNYFESEQIETEQTKDRTTEAIGYVLIVVCLLVITLFIIYNVNKKKEN